MIGITNKLIILAAPSGSGKTSISKYLLKQFSNQLLFSISCATRLPRSSEKNGVDYYFLSLADFEKKIENNEFAEWEMVYEGKYYGTLKEELLRIWQINKVPLLDVDVAGGVHLKKLYPKNTLSIFIEPPSLIELKKRLIARGTESESSLQMRLKKAEEELTFKNKYDFSFVNDNLEICCGQVSKLVHQFLLH